ncbi:MAG: type VI secretion system baseplate subunit TssG [Spirochaetaceae bacterium]|jgi:type VI secretion system protein ImpH|nr:type VI secretion system baseplate subunit TssG [Spirochaetaceae bacterium]
MEDIRRSVKKASGMLRSGKHSPDFWGFVRSLEQAARSNHRFGHAKSPSDENVRFGQMPYLHFPGADIADIIEGGPRGVDATVITYFFGLLGTDGPMPLDFTNYVFQRSYNEYDHTWRCFLDIIHHRMLMFYYRAYTMYQQSICFDRPQSDPFSAIIKSLAGLPPNANVDEKQETITLAYAKHLSFVVKNRSNLEDMLRRIFTKNIKVRDFIVSGYDIPRDCRAVLGNPNTAKLGINMQIGRRYLSRTQKFEIHIGPVDFNMYISIAGLTGFDILMRAINLYLDRPLGYDLVFTLRSQTIPSARLGFDWFADSNADAAQLGYTCWIGKFNKDETELSIDYSKFLRKKGRAIKIKGDKR